MTPSDSESEHYESDEELQGVKAAPKEPEKEPEKEPHGPDSDVEQEPEKEPEKEDEKEPEKEDPAPIVKEKKRPAPKKKKTESDPESDPEDPDAVPVVKEKVKKTKKEKVKGTPLDAPDAELKKEDMEEKAPKKGKYRGKKELLTEIKWNEEDYLTKDGRYYAPETLELVAWTKTNGEIILL